MADHRYVDETGTEWASEFEYRVFEGLQLLGYDVRKCGEGDSFDYTSTVTRGHCLECGSSRIGQRRTYTPDLYVSDLPGPNGPEGRYIEAKGYWPAHKRNLLRSAVRSNPDTHLVFVFPGRPKSNRQAFLFRLRHQILSRKQRSCLSVEQRD